MATTAHDAAAAGPATAPARLTADEYWRHPLGREPGELVHGELRMMSPTGGAHGQIVKNVLRALDRFVAERGLGECFADNVGFALPRRDDTVRSPDAAFVPAARLPADGVRDGWLRVAPALAVAVLSPGQSHEELVERRDDYFAAGTALLWVVHPRRRGVEVLRPDAPPRWAGEDDTLDGAPVLAGFALPVRAVFAGVAPPGPPVAAPPSPAPPR